MKNILTAFLLVFTTTTFAQRYTTNSVSEYHQVYGKKYTLVETTVDIRCTWEVSDKKFYRECEGNGGADWIVAKVIKIPNGKKYIIDTNGLDDIWVIVDQSGFIQLYENNGETMRKFRISKKEAIK